MTASVCSCSWPLPPLYKMHSRSHYQWGVSSSPYYHLTPPPLTIHLPSSTYTSSDVNYVSTHICHTNSYCYADTHSRTDTQVAPTSIITDQLKQDNTWSYQHVTYCFYRPAHTIKWWEGFTPNLSYSTLLNSNFTVSLTE